MITSTAMIRNVSKIFIISIDIRSPLAIQDCKIRYSAAIEFESDTEANKIRITEVCQLIKSYLYNCR